MTSNKYAPSFFCFLLFLGYLLTWDQMGERLNKPERPIVDPRFGSFVVGLRLLGGWRRAADQENQRPFNCKRQKNVCPVSLGRRLDGSLTRDYNKSADRRPSGRKETGTWRGEGCRWGFTGFKERSAVSVWGGEATLSYVRGSPLTGCRPSGGRGRPVP